jgi:hypothetical protein
MHSNAITFLRSFRLRICQLAACGRRLVACVDLAEPRACGDVARGFHLFICGFSMDRRTRKFQTFRRRFRLKKKWPEDLGPARSSGDMVGFDRREMTCCAFMLSNFASSYASMYRQCQFPETAASGAHRAVGSLRRDQGEARRLWGPVGSMFDWGRWGAVLAVTSSTRCCQADRGRSPGS